MYIKIKVTPQAKKELIEKESEDYFKISVKEPAQKNQANKRIIEMLAHYFERPTNKIHIVNGHHHPSKLISIGD